MSVLFFLHSDTRVLRALSHANVQISGSNRPSSIEASGVNVKGTFCLYQATARQMIKQGIDDFMIISHT
ncbi:uncharacterized protein BDV17DRAFT_253893 [Aspergillus undulatus]|uniref:uncharacterized protein n=1 Tax=Aspergillus undulatus TaxID=1810928 RepID=UPI003CCDBD92